MQVQMNDIDAHVAGSRHANQRIHVRAVHVNQTAGIVNYAANFLNVSFEQSERVRIRQHQTRHIAMRADLAQVIEIGKTFRRRSNCLDGESGQMRRGRVRPVR